MDSVSAEREYRDRVQAEQVFFQGCEDVHELPDIFHYWSLKYLRPKLTEAGIRGVREFFEDEMARLCAKGQASRFVSLGSGNCDYEIGMAAALRSAGYEDFVIECVDMNPAMLERGGAAAREQGLQALMQFVQGDFNDWNPPGTYDAVIANQSLHHVMNLESLFAAVKGSLRPGGRFLIGDMIGRNGHLRWPEAKAIVQEYWRRLPPSYRWNHQLQRYEEWFQDWDCSVSGFEGIRAQDILPLLCESFSFEKFLAYGNVVDVFIDRSFGPNFRVFSQWDRGFIDEIHARDEAEMAAGRITPTHVFAVAAAEPVELQFAVPKRPERCIRKTSGSEDDRPEGAAGAPYAWGTWPHDLQAELQLACGRLEISRQRYQELLAETERVRGIADTTMREFEDRTEWALKLRDLVDERTQWAQNLDAEVNSLTARLIEALKPKPEPGVKDVLRALVRKWKRRFKKPLE